MTSSSPARVGRRRGRVAAVRIRAPHRAAARSRAARHQSLDPHPAGFRQDLHRPAGKLEIRERAAARRWTTAGSICRAARRWAAPARSTAWSISAATTPTTTSGASAAAPAGTGIRCCRISAKRENQARGAERISRHRRPAERVGPAGTVRIVRGRAGRLRAGRHPAQPRLQRRPARRAAAITRPPRATAAAGAPRRPTCEPARRAPNLTIRTGAHADRAS